LWAALMAQNPGANSGLAVGYDSSAIDAEACAERASTSRICLEKRPLRQAIHETVPVYAG